MDWKEAEALFLELRDCLLVHEDLTSSRSSQRALIARKESGRLTRMLSEILARGEKYWNLPGRHYEAIVMDDTAVTDAPPVRHVDSIEELEGRRPQLIPEGHMREVCLSGQGAKTCCLLVASRHGFECMLGTNLELILRNRAHKGETSARAVNCTGPPEGGPQAGDAVYYCPRCGNPGLPSTGKRNCCTACANHLRFGHMDPKGCN